MTSMRPAAVAGMFYPGQESELSEAVKAHLATAPKAQNCPPKVLIVPHAGYIYSGQTAAMAYAELRPWRSVIKRVVLLGPTHRVAVNGLALPTVNFFSTPLGNIPLDSISISQLAELPHIVFSDLVHAQEHSLEVQLPFLQAILDEFTLIPVAVGNASPQVVATLINRLWGGDETLIVISTDLSHFHAYAVAQHIDDDTCQRILQLDPSIRPEQACGAYPLNGMLEVAQQRQLKIRMINHCNSGDTAGDKLRVVGYASFALY